MLSLTPLLLMLTPGADPRPLPPPASAGSAIGSAPGAAAGALIGNETDKRHSTDLDAVYASELIDILNTTKSPQTYFVTLALLAESKAEPMRIVPVALRNAERLGIFGRTVTLDPNGPPGDITGPVAEMIVKLSRRDRPLVTASASEPAEGLPGQVVPVQPWEAPRGEKKSGSGTSNPFQMRPPVRGALPAPRECGDEPTDRQVRDALPKTPRGIPRVFEQSRSDFRIAKELESETLDPVRVYPLVGCAQAHHSNWKCTVTFVETTSSEYPFPTVVRRERTEVVRVRTTHLHVPD